MIATDVRAAHEALTLAVDVALAELPGAVVVELLSRLERLGALPLDDSRKLRIALDVVFGVVSRCQLAPEHAQSIAYARAVHRALVRHAPASEVRP